jgi:protease-4
MGVAASGGYYICLPADFILAHPTTLTGSIGVIFLRPGVSGLMGKLGLDVEVAKSGVNKDMGSPFRPPTAGEKALFQSLTDRLGQRFLQLVSTHRHPTPDALADIASARVYLAPEALALGLVDQIGYLPAALGEARRRAGLPEDSRVVVYRRQEYPDDTLYNPQSIFGGGFPPAVVDLGLPTGRPAGFYYLWPAAAFDE